MHPRTALFIPMLSLLVGMVLPAGAVAQPPAGASATRPAPAPVQIPPGPPAVRPPIEYQSALDHYRKFDASAGMEDWHAVNARVQQRGGWREYARESARANAAVGERK